MSVELIAECSSNHGGDRGLMEAFIAQYADAGADWVKFQSYQVRTLRPGDPQREWLARAELSDADHEFLIERCACYGTKFLTTVFHASRVPFLASLGLKAIKIGSGESGEQAIVDATISAKIPRLIVSMGVSNVFYDDDYGRVDHLRCVSRYPAPAWMCEQRPYPFREVGWSDHCVGVEICKKAIFKGARIIEKHVSLPEQPRPKRAFEATVDEFRELRAFANDDPARFIGRWQHGD